MSRRITDELRDVTQALLNLLRSFDAAEFNAVPEEGGWTAAQVAEHLRLSAQSILRSVYAPGVVTDRLPDANVETLRRIFDNDEQRLNAPEIAMPAREWYDQKTLLRLLKNDLNKLIEADNSLRILETCTYAELPFFEGYTRFELMHFVVYHTRRHIRQLKKIRIKSRQTAG